MRVGERNDGGVDRGGEIEWEGRSTWEGGNREGSRELEFGKDMRAGYGGLR